MLPPEHALDHITAILIRTLSAAAYSPTFLLMCSIYCIQNFKTPISVVWGVQRTNFCTEMGYGMMKQQQWACILERHTNVRGVVLPFQQGSLLDEGWNRLITCLNFGIFNRPKTNSKIHTVYSGISEQIKPLQLVAQSQSPSDGRVQVWVQAWVTLIGRKYFRPTLESWY